MSRFTRWLASLVAATLCLTEVYAEAYYTHPVRDDIHTLRLVAGDDFCRPPVIRLGGDDHLVISFDLLQDEEVTVRYHLVHLNALWQPDDLSPLDYVNGFFPARVDNVSPSFNTTVNYWHYTLTLPSDDVQPLVSGNYAALFYEEDHPDDVLAVACFSMSEETASIEGTASSVTDVDFKAEHQQLALTLHYSPSAFPLLIASRDVRLVVTQNQRPDTRRDLLAPTRMDNGTASYEHDPLLLFEAGNTYRRFEFTDHRYATFGVENVRFQPPYYEVSLLTESARSGSFYRYDEDQHGRSYIHALRVDDPDIEGDYFYATFRLKGNLPPLAGRQLYLTGDFTYGECTPAYALHYDTEAQCYTARLLLKQGHYNYQFLAASPWKPAQIDAWVTAETHLLPPTLAPTEGNYYETHNAYEVSVYYHAPTDRYDRLLTMMQLTY